MTLENCERLLKHYEATGNKKAAENIQNAIDRKSFMDPAKPSKKK